MYKSTKKHYWSSDNTFSIIRIYIQNEYCSSICYSTEISIRDSYLALLIVLKLPFQFDQLIKIFFFFSFYLFIKYILIASFILRSNTWRFANTHFQQYYKLYISREKRETIKARYTRTHTIFVCSFAHGRFFPPFKFETIPSTLAMCHKKISAGIRLIYTQQWTICLCFWACVENRNSKHLMNDAKEAKVQRKKENIWLKETNSQKKKEWTKSCE